MNDNTATAILTNRKASSGEPKYETDDARRGGMVGDSGFEPVSSSVSMRTPASNARQVVPSHVV
jgi:hypothetical protein